MGSKLGAVAAARGALVVTLVAALVVSGCAAMQRKFDPALIKAVGQGSLDLEDVVSTLDPRNLAGSVTASETHKFALLAEGRLDKLSGADLDQIDKVNTGRTRHFDKIVEEVDGIRYGLQIEPLDETDYHGLSGDTTAFVRAWNAFLGTESDRLRNMTAALHHARPIFRDFALLVKSAKTAKQAGSAADFERARLRVVRDAAGRTQRLQTQLTALSRPTPADRALNDLLKHNGTAQDLVSDVNDKYPGGYLATHSGTQ